MDGHKYTALFEAPGGEPVLQAYQDTRGIWTIGIGHTGPEVHDGVEWSYDRCMATFYSDYAIASAEAPQVVGSSCWLQLNDPRRAVLTDMCFNIGKPRLEGFTHMLAALKAAKWQTAHDELLNSQYAMQVKNRADVNAKTLLTGEWPE